MYLDIGVDEPGAVRAALEERVKEAEKEGFSKSGQHELRELLKDFEDIFRLKLGNDPPADVTLMKIRLKPNSKPIKVKARRYAHNQRKFLNKYIDQLVKMGMLIEMSTAKWQSVPLLVLKPGTKVKYRMAIDIKPLNAATSVKVHCKLHVQKCKLQGVGKTWG